MAKDNSTYRENLAQLMKKETKQRFSIIENPDDKNDEVSQADSIKGTNGD